MGPRCTQQSLCHVPEKRPADFALWLLPYVAHDKRFSMFFVAYSVWHTANGLYLEFVTEPAVIFVTSLPVRVTNWQ
jgi:hypothetical protein